MKVLGLVASPRKGSNTELLVNSVLFGAGASGHTIDKQFLYDMNILPCVDCRACKKGTFRCAIADDMQNLYPKLEKADVIVFGTPLYWYGPSAKMKLLIDRLRPYVGSKKLRGKKAILLVPSEEGSEACNPILEMFRLSLRYLEVDIFGKLFPKASEYAELKTQANVLNLAFELGKSIK